MSKIIVDQIQKTSGTALTWPAADGDADQVIKTDGSGALSFVSQSGAGKMGQVVQTAVTTTTSYGVATTWADIAGMTVTITPTATSSKILLMTDLTVCGAATYTMHWRFDGGGTPIGIGTSATGSRTNCTQSSQSQTTRTTHNMGMTFLHSPSTTSAFVYKLQWFNETGNTIWLNRTNADGDVSYSPGCMSTITAIEVLA